MKGLNKASLVKITLVLVVSLNLDGCSPPRVYHTAFFREGEIATKLDFRTLYFEVTEYYNFYDRIVTPTGRLPVEPSRLLPVDFAEGDPFEIDLAGSEISYYDNAYDKLYVGSNGVVGFGEPGGGNKTLEGHFRNRQISLLPIDASDDPAGSVRYGIFSDAVVITYEDVDGSSAQLEFFTTSRKEKDFAISYAGINLDVSAGVVGLSNAQLESNPNLLDSFENSDLAQTNTNSLKSNPSA